MIKIHRLVLLIALVCMGVAVWPTAGSLAQLTGEENLRGQLVGTLDWLNTITRPQPNLAPFAVTTKQPETPFGINLFLEQEPDPTVSERTFALLDQAGIRFARQQFVWEDIEIHTKGDFSDRRNNPDGILAWDKYDHIVDTAVQYNVQLIGRIDNPPLWSRAAGDANGSTAPPDNFDDYGDFVRAVVERYRGRVRYFQLWNEPNARNEWSSNIDPEAFTRLLCTGYRAAKQAYPEAIILAPPLSPTNQVQQDYLNDLIFLQRMYDAGAADCFDILSAQGYGLRSSPTDRRLQPSRINFNYLLYTRDLMVANGDAATPLWVSETGWNALPIGMVPEGQEMFGQVSLEQQAKYAVELYQRARAEWPWAGVLNYWFLRRPSAETTQQYYYFRIMEPDFTPLPAWNALSTYTQSPLPPQTAVADTSWRPILFTVALATFLFTLTAWLPYEK